jgi:hypothetical protein
LGVKYFNISFSTPPLPLTSYPGGKAPTFKISVVFLLFVWKLAGEKKVGTCSNNRIYLFFGTSIVVCVLLAGSGTWSFKSLFPSRVARVFVFLPSTGRKSK